jgi:hypothetical protein
MKEKIILTLLISLFVSCMAKGQESSDGLYLTLGQAQDYAISNNKTVLSARLDVEASRAALWETISNALPSIEGSGTFNDNLKMMTTLLRESFLVSRERRYL